MSVLRSGTARRGIREFWLGNNRLRIDYDAADVHVNDSEISLTPTQYRVLECLAANAGAVMSSADIIADVWGEWYGSDDNLFVHIHHIRAKLGPCRRLIRTKRTMGYLLQSDPPPDGRVSASAGLALDQGRPPDQVDGARRFVLTYDLQSRLVGISPGGPFLGWQTEQLIGAPFVVEGLDMSAVERITRILLLAADGVVGGPQTVAHADGRRIPVEATLHLSMSEGSAGGYTIELLIGDEQVQSLD